MRDAARELAHRLHLLRLGGLHLEDAAIGGVDHVDDLAFRRFAFAAVEVVARQGADVEHHGDVARAVEADLHRRDRHPRRRALEHLGDFFAHRRIDDFLKPQADQVVAHPAEHRRQGVVGLGHHRIRQAADVDDRDPHRGFVEHPAGQAADAGHPGLVGAAVDVAHHRRAGQGFAVFFIKRVGEERGEHAAAHTAQAHQAAPCAVDLGAGRALRQHRRERLADEAVGGHAEPIGEGAIDVAERLLGIEGVDPGGQEIEKIAEVFALAFQHVLDRAPRRDVGGDQHPRALRRVEAANFHPHPVTCVGAVAVGGDQGEFLGGVEARLIGPLETFHRLAVGLGIGEPGGQHRKWVGLAPEALALGIGGKRAALRVDDAERPDVAGEGGFEGFRIAQHALPLGGLAQNQERADQAEPGPRQHRPGGDAAAGRAAEHHAEAQHHDQRAPRAETLDHRRCISSVRPRPSVSGGSHGVSAFF